VTNRFLIALLVAPAALAAEVEPGNWELGVATTLPGAEKPVAVTQAHCISAADAKDPTRLLGTGGSCQFSNRSDSGSVFTFEVSCGGLLPLRGSGSIRYTPQSIEGDLDLAADAGGGQKFAMRTHVSGRRTGPCAR